MNPSQLRAQAAKILSRLLTHDGSLASLLQRDERAQDQQSFPLLQEILFGTCRWYFQLDAILTQPLKAKDNDVRCLLLIGIYQLHHLRVPEYAVVNETVSATKVLKKEWAKGLTNAILRGFIRDQDKLVSNSLNKPQGQYAHPQWFIKRLQAAWPETWQQTLVNNNLRPPMTLRINTQKIPRQQFLENLAGADMAARAGNLASTSVYLEQACPVQEIPGFDNGLFSVQDEASQLIPDLMELADGQRLLDACAAPGGKTCHILESGYTFDSVLALDNDARRLERLQQNLERLQLSAVVKTGDAGDTTQWWNGQTFDRILLDAPCSATGIIRRHPDIKLLRQDSDIVKLQELQLHLLETLWQCLAPNGLLLYSTCSVLPEENSFIVERFLQRHSDVKVEGIQAQWGVECPTGRQLLPQADANDGFFFARLRKPSTALENSQ
jgi:16S rRNA (cytosine967-C5)-methyltransferase